MPSPIYKLINQKATILATQIATAAVTASQTKVFSNPNQLSTYTPTANDVGLVITMPTASGNVFVTPGINKSGDTYHIFNNSSGTITITQNTGTTIYFANTISVSTAAATGNRVLSSKGYASLTCLGANNYIITTGFGVF